MLVSDADLAAVFTAPEAVGDARAIRTELINAFGVLVSQAHAAGALHPDLGVEDLHHLVCGIQVAVRLSGDAGAVERYVGVLLAGARAPGVIREP